MWRLAETGLVVRYDPSLVALHDVRGSLREWLGRKVLYGTGGASLAARHGRKVAPAVLSLPLAVGAAAVLQRRRWSAPVAAAAVALTARPLARTLPEHPGSSWLAARLSLRGLGWAVRQESGLLLRHWWPATVAAALVSRRVRRAVLTALAVDTFVLLRERPGVGVGAALVGRRLDDLAYGAGLWWGALRARSPRCLAVRRVRPPRSS